MDSKVYVLAALLLGVIGGYSYGSSQSTEMIQTEVAEEQELEQASEKAEKMPGMDMNDEGLPMGKHNHPMRQIDTSLPTPSVKAIAHKDTMGGYNIEIITENFEFAPENINTEPTANEGHAHIYVNDVKIARVYSNWFNLDNKHFTEGTNTVEVTLNANDHSEWAIGEEHVQSTLKLQKNNPMPMDSM